MSSNNVGLIPKELNTAIKMLGDTWVLCIVSNLAQKPLRFCELERAIQGVNPVTLTNRLKRLESEKIVSKELETVDKLSVVYNLTDKGKAILPIINQIEIYGKKFFCTTNHS
jgi:DNA-binding HxlR family transcriptional regulator